MPGETITSVPKQGFETALAYDGFAEYVVVVALDQNGQEIGRSETVKTTRPVDALDISIAKEVQW